jgi:ribulose-5-phosphate 4-epimerase/fuculose-1-phosphate aldolase
MLRETWSLEIHGGQLIESAVVHTHAPALIPFGACATRLQPLYHMCGFLGDGAPVFDIAEEYGTTDMLITDRKIGRSLQAGKPREPIAFTRWSCTTRGTIG